MVTAQQVIQRARRHCSAKQAGWFDPVKDIGTGLYNAADDFLLGPIPANSSVQRTSGGAGGLGAIPGMVMTPVHGAMNWLARQFAGPSPQQNKLLQPLQNNLAQQNQRAALEMALAAGAGGIGLGLLGRGLVGAKDQALSAVKNPTRVGGLASVHVPARGRDEEEKRSEFDPLKWFKGDYAGDKTAVPWAIPATVAATVGGGMLGWGGLDKVLDRRRRLAVDQELNDAKREYEAAIMGKQGSVLGAELDRLYDKIASFVEFEKESSPASDAASQAAGLYLTMLLGTGALGAYGGYRLGRSGRSRKLLEEASRRRRDQLFSRTPPMMIALRDQNVSRAPRDTEPQLSAAPRLM